MRTIQQLGIGLGLLLFCGASLCAAEPPPLTPAEMRLFESLFEEFLFDPEGAERVAVLIPNRTSGFGENLVTAEGWCVRGTAGKPDVVHFADGATLEVKPEHELVPVNFLAACRGRLITEPPNPLDEIQLREFRKRGWEAAKGLNNEHDVALAAWLYRFGEPKLAVLALQHTRLSIRDDAGQPRQNLRKFLANSLYTRVFQCYVRREDQAALEYGEMLERRFPEHVPDAPPRVGPSLVDELRRRKKADRIGKPFPDIQPEGYLQWPIEKQVAYQIDSLDEVDSKQFMNPGSVLLEWDPRVKEIVRLGDAAVPALIDTLEHDERLVRSADMGRTWNPTGSILSVRDPAFAALKLILRIPFPQYQGNGYSSPERLKEQGPEHAQKLAAFAREYWQQHGQLPFEQRTLKILRESSSPWEQLVAAQNLADLGTDSQLNRLAFRDVTSANRRGVPPVETLLKLENPTVAEAIVAAMENAEKKDATRANGEISPEQRRRERQSYEVLYLPCLVKLGDRRIAPQLRARLDEGRTPLGRLELAAALHYLGDSRPLTDFANEFRQGKIDFPKNEELLFKWPQQSSGGYYSSNLPPGQVLVRALSSAKLPAADQALDALADKQHPQHQLAVAYYLDNENRPYNSARAEHPFVLNILRLGLDNRTPTEYSAVVHGNNIRHHGGKYPDDRTMPEYLRNVALVPSIVEMRQCDLYALRLSELTFGCPRYHPLLSEVETRFAELKLFHDRYAGRLRTIRYYERNALELRDGAQFVPDMSVLTQPATPADVAAGRALFSLPQKAVLAGLKLPATAQLARDQALPNPPRVLIVQAEVDAAGKTSYGVIARDGLQVVHDGELVNIESFEVPKE